MTNSTPFQARTTRLPTPNAEEIAAFTSLYKREFGVELEPDVAADLATRLLRIAYIKSFSPSPPDCQVLNGTEAPEGNR